MKYATHIRSCTVASRITAIALLLGLSGCWEFAGPAIGVGALGTGVVAAVKHRSSSEGPNSTLASQDSTEVSSNSDQPNVPDVPKQPNVPVANINAERPITNSPMADSPPKVITKNPSDSTSQHHSAARTTPTKRSRYRSHKHTAVVAALRKPPSVLPETVLVH